MKTAAAQFRDRPEPKRRQDLDDIAVLERLRKEQRDVQDVLRPTQARPIEEALGRPPAPSDARPQRPPSRGPSRSPGREPDARARRGGCAGAPKYAADLAAGHHNPGAR